MIVAILIGRKGSKGFPGKNLYPIFDKPLAWYPVNAANGCKEIDELYVSTDDELLMAMVKDNGGKVIERPAALCTDAALGEDVYLHAYDVIKNQKRGKEIELMALLMCNAPSITSAMMSEGIKALRENPEYDSAVSVSKYNMWSPLRARRIEKDGLLHPFVPPDSLGDPKKLNCDRDSQGDVWFADMGVSIIRPRCLQNIETGLLPQKWMGRHIYPIRQWGGLDVDYEWQIPQVEYWVKKNLHDKKGKV